MNRIRITSKGVKEHKYALKELLLQYYGEKIETEKSFDWMIAKLDSSERLKSVYETLVSYRGNREFFSAGFKPKCDFVNADQKLIIEYDERQHFSIPRKIAIETYKDNISLYYNASKWIEACESIHAIDNDPHYRDEQRAFYDSVRDIAAFENGYKLIRIMHGAYDWTDKDAFENLKTIVDWSDNRNE